MIDGSSWPQRHRSLLTALLLMLAAWAIYLPSVRYGFVYYDDVRILLIHPELYGQANFSDNLHKIFIASFPREEPLLLRDVSWALDSKVFGFGNAFGYHLGNVFYHGLVGAVMFVFLLGTTRRYSFALAVTAGWLVLAIHTEPVDWIMGRKDILSTLFMLLALCAQTRRLAAKNLRAKCGWYLFALVGLIAGLLSKISVLTFPLVLFLHAIFLPYLNGERTAHEKFPGGHNLAKEILLMLPGLVISVLIYGWYRQTLTQMGILDRGYTAHGLTHLWNLLIVDPFVLLVYVKQAFIPWHLGVFYAWPQMVSDYPRGQIISALALVTVAIGLGLWLFQQRKDLFFYFTAFIVIMIPYLNLIYSGIIVAERYLYFSAFCLLALGGSVITLLLRRPQPLVRGVALAACVCFVSINLIQTFLYQPAWRNGETLWQYHLTLPNSNPSAYANLAAYYYAQAADRPGTTEMAVTMRKMSIAVDTGLAQFWPDPAQPPPPETYFLFFLKSIVQEVQGEPEAALASLLTADRLRPQFDSTQLNLALLYHTLAGNAVDSGQKQTYACAARDRYAKYIALTWRGRPAPAEIQNKLAAFEADCSSTNSPAEKISFQNRNTAR